jgi:outer membrane receptor for ferrienterochelin and colicin
MILLGCVLIATPLLAQNPTGTITGRVSTEGGPLPGVTVTADSPAMQGQKVDITGGAGEYIFRFLPPGEYTISFALDGFTTLEIPVVISAAQSKSVDAEMYAEAVREEIVVTGQYDTVSVGTQSNVTMQQSVVEQLPVARTMDSAVLLTPGTGSAGPGAGDAITISGAQSYENLFMINGVVTNENLRGQSLDLFIEDAIQETTTTASGVSAEYGRFAGGVVNMLTKSGGNEFSGSLRLNLTNDSWNGKTPLTTDQTDKINQVWEGTFGGYVVRDRLWFFLAGRDRATETSRQLYDQTPYTYSNEQQRYEGKLTWSPHANHRLIGSYMQIDQEVGPYDFFTATEPRAMNPARQDPQDLWSINYTGVLTESFFLEGQYAERHYTFENSGGTADPGDRINGTVIYYPNFGAQANSDVFCGQCDPEFRDMENALIKASWFLSGAGTHDLVFGVDTYTDIRKANNYQSPSNFFIWNYNAPAYSPDGTFYPVFTTGEDLDYWPIFLTSAGTDFTTNSAYVNDTWRVNNNWTINVGVRYDKNDGQDGAGKTVADDSRISPRIGASWDIKGDGNWVLNASASRYVTAIANGVADSGGGGNPSYFGYTYGGPLINTDGTNVCGPDHPELCMYTSPEAMEIVFDWFDSVGGLSNTDLWYASPSIAGLNDTVENLDSPYTDEFAIGFNKRLGTKGLLRVDFVRRESHDFYAIRRDLSTGTVDFEEEVLPGVIISETFDLGVTYNEDDLAKRDYMGVHTALQYRFNDRLQVGATYTYSHAEGNVNGETSGSGPVRFTANNYPEYKRPAWSYPEGDLLTDQRHKLRAWLVWDFVSTSRWNISGSWLENYWSGTPYGANGSVVVFGAGDFWFDDPGYASPPFWQDYWFTDRDEFRTDNIHRSDISFNISFFIGRRFEIFLQPEVLNVFGEDGVETPNTRTLTWRNADLSFFDPYTVAPEQGVHWDYGDEFGQADTEPDFQTPRTFRFSVGFRF